MKSFWKNMSYVLYTLLIFAVPVLLTVSFCLDWDLAIQGTLWVACLFDFIVVLILVTAFAEASE